ncbi:MAG: hypothetical protein ACYCWW_16380 [Deltaproteobacteria bacterium]
MCPLWPLLAVALSQLVPPGEPTIQEALRAAEKASLLRPGLVDGWRARARASAWLPELSASAERHLGDVVLLGIRSGNSVDTDAAEAMDVYGVHATWKLPELVFSPQELSVEKAVERLEAARAELRERVVTLYFQRLRTRQKWELATEDARPALALELAEETARLDALTGGLFSMRHHHRPSDRPRAEGDSHADGDSRAGADSRADFKGE